MRKMYINLYNSLFIRLYIFTSFKVHTWSSSLVIVYRYLCFRKSSGLYITYDVLVKYHFTKQDINIQNEQNCNMEEIYESTKRKDSHIFYVHFYISISSGNPTLWKIFYNWHYLPTIESRIGKCLFLFIRAKLFAMSDIQNEMFCCVMILQLGIFLNTKCGMQSITWKRK